MDHGTGGGTRQHGGDADQVSARLPPLLLRGLRTAAGRVDTQKCRRLVRARLLRHIIFETLFLGHPEVNAKNCMFFTVDYIFGYPKST